MLDGGFWQLAPIVRLGMRFLDMIYLSWHVCAPKKIKLTHLCWHWHYNWGSCFCRSACQHGADIAFYFLARSALGLNELIGRGKRNCGQSAEGLSGSDCMRP